MAATYAGLIGDRRFIVPVLIAGFGQSVLLVFIAGSPFVFISLHGIKPATYGVLFACHAAGLIGISQFNAPMLRAVGVRRLLTASCLPAAGSLCGSARFPRAGRDDRSVAVDRAYLNHLHDAGPDPAAGLSGRGGEFYGHRGCGGGAGRGAGTLRQHIDDRLAGPAGRWHGAPDGGADGGWGLRLAGHVPCVSEAGRAGPGSGASMTRPNSTLSGPACAPETLLATPAALLYDRRYD
jgi:hypothetical protein